jgi:hypothetical protein
MANRAGADASETEKINVEISYEKIWMDNRPVGYNCSLDCGSDVGLGAGLWRPDGP